jgi:hypothetical protein
VARVTLLPPLPMLSPSSFAIAGQLPQPFKATQEIRNFYYREKNVQQERWDSAHQEFEIRRDRYRTCSDHVSQRKRQCACDVTACRIRMCDLLDASDKCLIVVRRHEDWVDRPEERRGQARNAFGRANHDDVTRLDQLFQFSRDVDKTAVGGRSRLASPDSSVFGLHQFHWLILEFPGSVPSRRGKPKHAYRKVGGSLSFCLVGS